MRRQWSPLVWRQTATGPAATAPLLHEAAGPWRWWTTHSGSLEVPHARVACACARAHARDAQVTTEVDAVVVRLHALARFFDDVKHTNCHALPVAHEFVVELTAVATSRYG